MSDQKRPTTENPAPPATPGDTAQVTRRRYASPVLTQYGRVDELVDSGVVGFTPSVTA